MRITLLGVVLLILSCHQETKTKFSLKGMTDGFQDGTVLYLDVENRCIDSVSIIDNSFVFNSILPYSPIQLLVRTRDFSQYRFLWVENKPIIFDAANSDFRNASVKGSELEDLSYRFSQMTDTLSQKERQEKEIDFVETNPNSIISASMLSLYATSWGKEKTKELYDMFSIENKESKFGKEIAKYLELNKEPKIGENYVDFESENQFGELKKLSNSRGKVTLLEFWASWCGPCRQENPNLVNTYEKFNSKGFKIFAVSLDENKEDWIEAIRKDNLNWIHVSDLQGDKNEASLIYGIRGIPDNFLISENGKVIARNLRGENLNQKLLELLE